MMNTAYSLLPLDQMVERVKKYTPGDGWMLV